MRTFALIILLVVSNLTFGQAKILTEKKTYFYSTQYSDSINNIFLKDTILFITTDIPWKHQPDKQKTVIWKYPHLIVDTLLKEKFKSIGWTDIDSTGAIENEKKYWIHPPRHNQFTITEIAPFPTVEFPCEINKRFKSFTYIGNGWGKWENLKLTNNYEFFKKEFRNIGLLKYECWIIKSESESELGKSYLTTAYNENIGFVEFNYSFYNKTKIKIELIKIE